MTKKKNSVEKDRGNQILISIKECLQTWKNLKIALIESSILIYLDFIRLFILYVNENKKQNYDVVLHQLYKDEEERSILFLSRLLSDAKTKYWSIELKIEVLVWALIKLLQYFDNESFTVVTNHVALKTALQTNITKKQSTRLNE